MPVVMTTDPQITVDPDRLAKRNLVVLIAASAIMGAQMPMVFIIAGLAGLSLASNPCFATLPISMVVLGSMITATPMSALMQRYGRQAGFIAGAAGGGLGAAICAYGLVQQSFAILTLGSLLTGIYMSAKR